MKKETKKRLSWFLAFSLLSTSIGICSVDNGARADEGDVPVVKMIKDGEDISSLPIEPSGVAANEIAFLIGLDDEGDVWTHDGKLCFRAIQKQSVAKWQAVKQTSDTIQVDWKQVGAVVQAGEKLFIPITASGYQANGAYQRVYATLVAADGGEVAAHGYISPTDNSTVVTSATYEVNMPSDGSVPNGSYTLYLYVYTEKTEDGIYTASKFESKEIEVASGPAVTDGTASPEASGSMGSPSSQPSVDPGASIAPGETQPSVPSASGQPGGEEKPSASGQPGGEEKPSASGQPGGEEKPSASGQPGGVEKPSASGQPGGEEKPSASGQPGGVEQPAVSGQPGGTGQPMASEKPGEAGRPSAAPTMTVPGGITVPGNSSDNRTPLPDSTGTPAVTGTFSPSPTAAPAATGTSSSSPVASAAPTLLPVPSSVAATELPETAAPTQAPAVSESPAASALPNQTADGEENQTPEPGVTVKKDNVTYKVTESGSAAVDKVAAAQNKKTVKVPDTVTVDGEEYKVDTISAGAFAGNKKLEQVTLGKNVKTVKKKAFSGCKNLEEVTLSNKVSVLGAESFSGCTSLKKITFPGSLKTIGNKAFQGCKSLKNVRMGKKAGKKKGGAVFAAPYIRTSKQGVVVVETVPVYSASSSPALTIGNYAFAACSSLKKVIINSAVRVIGSSAFRGCKKLSDIIVNSQILQKVRKMALKGINHCTISVPSNRFKPYCGLFRNKGQGKKVLIAKV